MYEVEEKSKKEMGNERVEYLSPSLMMSVCVHVAGLLNHHDRIAISVVDKKCSHLFFQP